MKQSRQTRRIDSLGVKKSVWHALCLFFHAFVHASLPAFYIFLYLFCIFASSSYFIPFCPNSNIAFFLQCGTIDDKGLNQGLTERSLQDAQRLYLMNDVVQPESIDPLVMQDDVRFSNLVVDIVQGMDTLFHVMYISTG